MGARNRVLLRLSVVRCLLGWLVVVVCFIAFILWGKYTPIADSGTRLLMLLGIFGLVTCGVPLALHYAITRCAVLRLRDEGIEEVGMFGRVKKRRTVAMVAGQLWPEVTLNARVVTPSPRAVGRPDPKDLKVSARCGGETLIIRLDSSFLSKKTRDRLIAGERIVIDAT